MTSDKAWKRMSKDVKAKIKEHAEAIEKRKQQQAEDLRRMNEADFRAEQLRNEFAERGKK